MTTTDARKRLAEKQTNKEPGPSSARFEVVHTDAGWHARFRATNGELVWWTETYTRRNAAVLAVHQIAKPIISTPWEHGVMVERHGAVEVREVDDRDGSSPLPTKEGNR